MNTIIGNSNGAFSGLLCQLAWMLISEDPENDLNVQIHTSNKTNSLEKNFVGTEESCTAFEEGRIKNLLLKFFKENNFISNEIPDGFTYIQHHPIDIFKTGWGLIKNYPDYLLHKSCTNKQFKDKENLEKVSKALNRQWNKLELNDKFLKLAEKEQQLISNKKVLSIMLRTTKHYLDPNTQLPLTDTGYVIKAAIDSVKNKIDNYDSVLLVTQIQPFVDEFVKEFGDKCVFTERERFKTDCDWKGGRPNLVQRRVNFGGSTAPFVRAKDVMDDKEYEAEYRNVLLDVLLTSKTSHILGSTSNMLMGALTMNPKISFSFIENLSDHGGA